MQYVYIIRVCVEGFVASDVVPMTAVMTNNLVRKRIMTYKAMGGLAYVERDRWRARRC